MFIVNLDDCPEFKAGDATLLKEMLNPDRQKLDIRYSLARAILPAGKSSLLHSLTTTEVFYIISGNGEMHINNEVSILNPGDTVVIPPNAKQFIKNDGTEDLVFLAIVDPTWRKQNETVY